MHEATWGYIAVCIAVPMLWGLATEWVFGRVEGYLRGRRRTFPEPDPHPAVHHHRTPGTLDYRI